jgi:hypothetical protein
LDNFWTHPENFEYPDSPNLVGKLKVGGNMFFQSSEPVSAKQIDEILNTLIDYPQLRFVKFEIPNLKVAFTSTHAAEEYLSKLASR